MVNQPLVGMGVASKEKFIGSKTFRNGLKLTNQNGNYFICKREGSFVMSLQIIMMFQWGLTLLNY
jgi:hypothetical protein